MKFKSAKFYAKLIISRLLSEKTIFHIKKKYYPYYLKTLKIEDEPDIRPIKYLISEGDSVIDIGANIGVYTKFLSDFVGTAGRVYSIEPIPITFKLLKYNVERLKLHNVELFQYAISDKSGMAFMDIPFYKYGLKNFYKAKIVKHAEQNKTLTTVKCESIDSFLKNVQGNIAFIKIDVEGHEFECIEGAKSLLKMHKPAWLIEVSSNPDIVGSHAYEIHKLFKNHGYESFWLDKNMLRKRSIGDISINYFFFNKKHIQILKASSYIT